MENKTKYEIVYSNQNFDLRIIMHKKRLTGSSDYLKHINEVYGTNFESFDKL